MVVKGKTDSRFHLELVQRHSVTKENFLSILLTVYLRTTPEIVYQRMRQRARKEEDCVSLEYLQQVHDIHDEWLYDQTLFTVPAPVITLDANQSMEDMFKNFESCKQKIFDRRGDLELDNRISMGVKSPSAAKKVVAGASD